MSGGSIPPPLLRNAWITKQVACSLRMSIGSDDTLAAKWDHTVGPNERLCDADSETRCVVRKELPEGVFVNGIKLTRDASATAGVRGLRQ